MHVPSSNGSNHRHLNGRFLKGNPGGPGNPYAKKIAALRGAMLSVVTEKDMKSICTTLVGLAKQGDVAAAKFVFGYVLGPSGVAVASDEEDETARQKQEIVMRLSGEEIKKLLGQPPQN
jgi:hypothetical protein